VVKEAKVYIKTNCFQQLCRKENVAFRLYFEQEMKRPAAMLNDEFSVQMICKWCMNTDELTLLSNSIQVYSTACNNSVFFVEQTAVMLIVFFI